MSMSFNVKPGVTISPLQMTLRKDYGNIIPGKMKHAIPVLRRPIELKYVETINDVNQVIAREKN